MGHILSFFTRSASVFCAAVIAPPLFFIIYNVIPAKNFLLWFFVLLWNIFWFLSYFYLFSVFFLLFRHILNLFFIIIMQTGVIYRQTKFVRAYFFAIFRLFYGFLRQNPYCLLTKRLTCGIIYGTFRGCTGFDGASEGINKAYGSAATLKGN